MLAFFGIVFGVVALAGVYGILHDQVTARVCLEYFTIGHPRIIDSTDPTMLALAWGVVATWWFALPFGLVAAGIARFGKGNQLSVAETLRLAALSLAVTGVLQDESPSAEGDASLTGGSAVNLRATRAGTGDGRIYEVAFTITDTHGASCSATTLVTVPHDQSGAPAVDSGVRFPSIP